MVARRAGSRSPPPCIEHGVTGISDERTPLVGQVKSSFPDDPPSPSPQTPGPAGSTTNTTSRSGTSSSISSWSWWRVGFVATAGATALAALAGSGRWASGGNDNNAQTSSLMAASIDSKVSSGASADQARSGAMSPEVFTFTAQNEYTRRGDVIGAGYPWLYGNVLVEPHRTTSLEVTTPVGGMMYSWTVYEHDAESGSSLLGEYEGAAVEVVFRKAPKYTVVLQEHAAAAAPADVVVTRRVEKEVFSRYVRREIRSLFDDERNEMFDAMKVLWDVMTEDGKKMYGDEYLDVWDIDKFHQVGASDITCDHLHDGIGFGITHSMVTMIFEKSMQLVNPKVSLPYWDFTIEAAIIDTEYDGDYTKARDVTDLWTADWFGGVDATDNQVKDGRWGYMEVPLVAQEHRDVMGADVYGRMRSPWSVNSQPYLIRALGDMCGIPSTSFYPWPTCETHYDMQDLYTSYYSYTWYSQYNPHGPMHVFVGGSVNCKDNIDGLIEIVGEDYRSGITGSAFTNRKDMFRDRMWQCHGIADADESAKDVMDSGRCGCTDLNLEEGDDYLTVYNMYADIWEGTEVSEEDQRKVAQHYCSGVVSIGESSMSSSPLDPTFWSLHPTLERLLSFKLMAGGFTDYSWPDEPGMWTGMDGTVYDVVLSFQCDECYGHLGSDVFPYGILDDLITPLFTFHGVTGPNIYSNRELIRLFDPESSGLTYIYDNFEWDHCAEQGFDFTDFFDTSTGEQGIAAKTGTSQRSGTTGKKKVNGFEMFQHGKPRGPLHMYNMSGIGRDKEQQTQQRRGVKV